MFKEDLEAFSNYRLLERGLECITHQDWSEALYLFAQARARLNSDASDLIDALDKINRVFKDYREAEMELHNASKRFVLAEIEQEMQIKLLQKLLPGVEDGLASSLGVTPKIASILNEASEIQVQPVPNKPKVTVDSLPGLEVKCFGRFEVRRQNGEEIDLCQYRKGQAVLRYLLTKPEHSETMDVLMALWWPDDESNTARHKLRVAVSSLRCALNQGYRVSPGSGYVLCKNEIYQLNPNINIHTDVEEFVALYHSGRKEGGSRMVLQYEQACNLYSGPFLTEDLYADWTQMRREQLSQIYLAMCEALAKHFLEVKQYDAVIKWTKAVLNENSCDENAYRQLIQAYAANGQRNEALRQYHRCESVLATELGVQPMPETSRLFYSVLNGLENPAQIELIQN